MTRHRIAVAPMMDWTDRHCRYFMRLLSPRVQLYTEMVTAAAIHHGDAGKLLRFDEAEHPVAVQLGGSEPTLMADAAARSAEAGYDEININVGCPSDRVQSGRFGACLMATPGVVVDCYRAMSDATDVPVTIKSRIGIDDNDEYDDLRGFVDPLAEAGVTKFIVHARVAILEGLSPKENRTVPPLRYEHVYRLKQDYPELDIVLNGGLATAEAVDAVLEHVDGVMIGRQAYHDPYFLAELDARFLSGAPPPERRTVVERMLPYVDAALAEGERLNRITRHMLGLYAGQPGARAWRRHLSENAHRDGADRDVILRALDALPQAA